MGHKEVVSWGTPDRPRTIHHRPTMRFQIIFTLVPGLVLIHVGEAEGQEPEGRDQRTVWDGVYTDAQARDGRMLADTKCIRCHGEALGGGNAQELLGDRFFERWREDTLASLYAVLRTMPPKESPLVAGDYLKILGYVLQSNGFPSGLGEPRCGCSREHPH